MPYFRLDELVETQVRSVLTDVRRRPRGHGAQGDSVSECCVVEDIQQGLAAGAARSGKQGHLYGAEELRQCNASGGTPTQTAEMADGEHSHEEYAANNTSRPRFVINHRLGAR